MKNFNLFTKPPLGNLGGFRSGIILTLTGLRHCQVIAPTTCQAAKLLTGSNIKSFVQTMFLNL